MTEINVFFTNTALLPAGGTLTVVISKVKLPPTTAPVSGFGIITGETYYDTQINSQSLYKVESVSTPTTVIANDTPANLIP